MWNSENRELLLKVDRRVAEHDVLFINFHKHQTVCDEERLRHAKQLEVMIETQKQMAETQQTMCAAQKISAEYDAKNSENLELIADLVLTGKTVKSSLIWIAAVVGAIGTIAAGCAAAWFYMSGILFV